MRYEVREQMKKMVAGVLSFGLAIVGAQEFGPDLVNFFNNLEQPNKDMSQAMGTDLHSATASELLAVHPNFELELCDLDAMQLNNIFINSTEGQDTPTTFISRNKATGEFETDMNYMDRFNAHVDLENDETLDLNSINSMEFKFSTPNTAIINEQLRITTEVGMIDFVPGTYDVTGDCSIKIENTNNGIRVSEYRNISLQTEDQLTVSSSISYDLIEHQGVLLKLPNGDITSISRNFNGLRINTGINSTQLPEIVQTVKSLFSFPPREE